MALVKREGRGSAVVIKADGQDCYPNSCSVVKSVAEPRARLDKDAALATTDVIVSLVGRLEEHYY